MAGNVDEDVSSNQDDYRASRHRMSALVLGAGMMSGPVFEYLHTRNIPFCVVSCLEKELQIVKIRYPDVQCHCMDVADPQLLALIAEHQLVINLLPPPLLVSVAELCISQCCDMLSASYASAELMHLHQRAVDAGVMLFCECGLDPGIDHMLAMEVIDKVMGDGGQVTSFTSWCGGVPAPECKDNPLQYKFSWNPKGALKASLRDAGYLENGQEVVVPASQLLNKVYSVDTSSLLPGVCLEGHANKFFPHHLQQYGLQGVKRFFRGTLRYQGFCNVVKGVVQAGLFSEDKLPILQPEASSISWRKLMSYLVTGCLEAEDFDDQLLAKLDNSPLRVEALQGLGLLSDRPVDKKGTPFDSLASLLQQTLAYSEGERDMIVMQHLIQYKMPGQRESVESVGLVVYGDPDGHSAMAKTVGFPVGIVAHMMLKGEIKRKGVVLPTTPAIYQPVLTSLASMGIAAQHEINTAVCAVVN